MTAINADDDDDQQSIGTIDEKEDEEDDVDTFLTKAKGDDFVRSRIDSTKTVDESHKDGSSGNFSDDSFETDSDLSILDSMSDDDLDQEEKAL